MLRDHLPLEQGLRLPPLIDIANGLDLRDHLPLEQGLRHSEDSEEPEEPAELRDHLPLEQGLRPAGITSNELDLRAQRPSAIRTRIKTRLNRLRDHFISLRDHLPLEQGLRPTNQPPTHRQSSGLRDHLPLEQGLRHSEERSYSLLRSLRDHLPLEQGLRQARAGPQCRQNGCSETICH